MPAGPHATVFSFPGFSFPVFLVSVFLLVFGTLTGCGQPSAEAPPAPPAAEPFLLLAPLEKPADPGPAGPARVLDSGPHGLVEGEPAVRIRFSQAMQPIGDVSSATNVTGVRMEPEVAGDWRWESPELLRFYPDTRFPIGQKFQVTVDPGQTGSTVATLEEPFSMEFETRPRLRSISWQHDESLGRVAVLRFNGEVLPGGVEGFISLERAAFEPAPVPDRVVPASWLEEQAAESSEQDDDTEALEEAEENEEAEEAEEEPYGPWVEYGFSVRSVSEDEEWGCGDSGCLVVVPEKPQYQGARLRVVVEAGYTSSEGPLASTVGRVEETTLPEPFRLIAATCSDNPCRPDSNYSLEFNGSLDREQEQETLVSWTGKEGSIWVSWNSISIYPYFEPESRQYIEVRRGIRSSSGETLEAMRFPVEVGPVRPEVTLPSHLTVIDRRSPHSLAAELEHVKRFGASMGGLPVDFWIPTLEAIQKGKPVPPEVAKRLKRAKLKTRRFDGGYSEALMPLADVVPQNASGGVFYQARHAEEERAVEGLAVFTRLGLSVLADQSQLVTQVTDLASAEPVQGVTVELYRDDNTRIASARSDARGIANLLAAGEAKHAHYLIARFEDDVAILPLGVRPEPDQPELAFTVIPDRRAYLPGDEVYVTGHARTMEQGRTLSGRKLTETVEVSIVDGSMGLNVSETVPLDEQGNFLAKLQLPARSGLGWAGISVKPSGDEVYGSGRTRIRIAEFRTPEFEVSVSPRPEPVNGKEPVAEQAIRGRELSVTVAGDLLNGSAMAEAPYEIRTRSRRSSWTISGWPRTRFGNLRPESWITEVPPGGAGKLDAGGRAVWKAVPVPGEDGPTSWEVEAEVTDTTRQTVASSAEILVHPGEFYLGLRLPESPLRNWVVGDEVEVELIAVHPDGTAFSSPERIGDIVMEIYEPPPSEQEKASADKDPSSAGENLDPSVPAVPDATIRCLPADAEAPPVVARCQVAPDKIGTWRIAARATDGLGNTLTTKTWLGVYEESKERGGRVSTSQRWGLIADKDDYAPGEVAKLDLRVRGDFLAGLFAFGEVGMRSWSDIEMLDGSLREPLEIPVTEHESPRFGGVSVVYEKREKWELSNGEDWGRPRAEVDRFIAYVDRGHMGLDVTVTPLSETARPGEDVEVRVEVRDSQGEGRQSQVTLWAVDEGVLLIEPHEIPDPLSTMHPWVFSPVSAVDIRQHLALRLGLTPKDTVFGTGGMGVGGSGAGGGGSMAKMGGVGAAVIPRGNFITTPYFEALSTNAEGEVTAKISLPDNLTRFKLFAVASADTTRFGHGESSIEVNKPVMLRPTMPRFAAKGDRLNAGVVVQNATSEPLDATVEVALSGALESDGSTSQSTRVAAGRSAELTFPMRASTTGTATATFRMEAGAYVDAVELTLPVKERVVTETTAAYGVLEDTALAIPLVWPEPLRKDVGGLSMSLSSTRLTGLKDAADYLIQYPHGCLEQTSSRLMPIALLGRIDPALTGVSVEEMAEKMEVGLARLREMQRGDGAFNYWPRGDVHRYASMWATLALLDVEANGLDTGDLLSNALTWVETDVFLVPDDKSTSQDLIAVAFAGYLLAEAERLPPRSSEVLAAIGERYQELPLFGRLWLIGALHATGGSGDTVEMLIQSVLNESRETARAIHLVEPDRPELWRWFSSGSRTDAIALAVLLDVAPEHPALEKLATGLLDARKRGRWRNTQENAWVLRAMIGYLATFEAEEPAFSSGVWLGDEVLSQVDFVGRSSRVEEVEVPIEKVLDEAGPIVISRQGQGRLYYRIAATVAREDQDLEALDRGFALERIYELDGKEVEPGDTIPAGAALTVRLRFKTSDPRYFVALTDRLPAGLEGQDPQDKIRSGHGRQIFRGPFHHNEFRADRVSFYADQMSAGEHEVVYTARATTRGTFTAAPATIEEMYAPEVSGRTDRINVKVE